MEGFFEKTETILETFNSWVWHPYYGIVALLLLSGFYLTVRFIFPQIRFLFSSIASFSGKDKKINTNAFFLSIASSTGTGSIAGATFALLMGGPGAIFWMWIFAFFAMAIKLTEGVLAQKWQAGDKDMKNSPFPLNAIKSMRKRWRWLGYFFAFSFILITLLGVGNTIHSNTIATYLYELTSIPKWISGIGFCAILCFFIFTYNSKTESLVLVITPLAILAYCLIAIAVIIFNFNSIPNAFSLIISGAFSRTAEIGGFAGAGFIEAIRYGVSRGVISNEAGLGSTFTAFVDKNATSDKTSEKKLSAMWTMITPVTNTMIIATLTSLMLMVTGSWHNKEKGELKITDVKVYVGEISSYKDIANGGAPLNGILNIKEGVMEGGAIFFSGRSIIESPKFFLDGKSFSGSLEFTQGKITNGTIYVTGEGEGILGRPMPHHIPASKAQISRIKMTGYYCPEGILATGKSLESKFGKPGKIFLGIIMFIFCLAGPVVWSKRAQYIIMHFAGKKFWVLFVIFFIMVSYAGTILEPYFVWNITDILNIFVIIPNLFLLWLYSGVAVYTLSLKRKEKVIEEKGEEKVWKKKKKS